MNWRILFLNGKILKSFKQGGDRMPFAFFTNWLGYFIKSRLKGSRWQ